MKRNLISILVPASMFLLACNGLFAQASDSSSTHKQRHNTISILLSSHDFFDGSPIVQRPTSGTIGWMNLAFGVEYARQLDEKNGLIISSTICNINNLYGPYPRRTGDLNFRVAYFIESCYQRQLLRNRHNSLAAIAGVNFRIGDENILLSRPFNDVNSYSYALRDVGITAGARATKDLISNFVITGELKFTQYIYRHAKHQPLVVEFPNRPTSNMLTLQLGIGYRF